MYHLTVVGNCVIVIYGAIFGWLENNLLIITYQRREIMSNIRKYRLGNEPEKYELVDKYLGWIPKGYKDWSQFHLEISHIPSPGFICTIMNPKNQDKVNLILRQVLKKGAFPISFLTEDRATNWLNFCLVSEIEKPEVVFVIPLH